MTNINGYQQMNDALPRGPHLGLSYRLIELRPKYSQSISLIPAEVDTTHEATSGKILARAYSPLSQIKLAIDFEDSFSEPLPIIRENSDSKLFADSRHTLKRYSLHPARQFRKERYSYLPYGGKYEQKQRKGENPVYDTAPSHKLILELIQIYENRMGRGNNSPSDAPLHRDSKGIYFRDLNANLSANTKQPSNQYKTGPDSYGAFEMKRKQGSLSKKLIPAAERFGNGTIDSIVLTE